MRVGERQKQCKVVVCFCLSAAPEVTTQDFVAAMQQRLPMGSTLSIVSRQTGPCLSDFPTLGCDSRVQICVLRLDYPTSGVLPLVVGAEGSLQTNWFRSQFAAGLVRKEYCCLCEGQFLGAAGACGHVDSPLLTSEVEGGLASRSEVSEHGREAFTQYEVQKRFRSSTPDASSELILLRVRPRTGRTHQIRVHMASIGRPLVGDFTYGQREETLLPSCPRLFLHCHRIELTDLEDAPFMAEAGLPADLRNVLQELGAGEIVE